MTDQAPAGEAAIVVTDRDAPPLGLLIALTREVLAAGKPLVDPARLRARGSASADADAGDVLAGNAALALLQATPDLPAAAACLGAIAQHSGGRALWVEVSREGGTLDCRVQDRRVQRLGGDTGSDTGRDTVRRALAARLGRPARAIVPGRLIRAAG
jgi:hypothetical protein